MSLKDVSQNQLQYLSMIELANLLLTDEKKALDFKEIFTKISEIKEFTKEQELDKLAQFYTDLNTDGRFMTLGSNVWGLKRWYPIDEIDDEVKVRHKKKAKEDDEDLLEDDENYDDEDLEVVDDDENVYEDDDEFKDIDSEIDDKVDNELLEDDEFDGESFEDEDVDDEDF